MCANRQEIRLNTAFWAQVKIIRMEVKYSSKAFSLVLVHFISDFDLKFEAAFKCESVGKTNALKLELWYIYSPSLLHLPLRKQINTG